MKRLGLILIAAYLTIVLGYALFQRNLIFHPTALDGTTPKDYSLSYEDVYFASPDGVTLNGWWIRHPQADPRRPVLLYCHGNAANLSHLAEVSRIFYDFGFDAFLFDYRGYGASGKAPSGLSETALDADALSAYRWLQSKGFKENRVLIWGHSLGSSVAAQLASQTHPAGLILEGAFPSIYAVSREKYPWLLFPPFLIRDKFCTENYVARRTCPLLEIHAERDSIIPLFLGRKVFGKAAEPKEWMTIEGINHNDFPSVARKYKNQICNFAKKCLRESIKP